MTFSTLALISLAALLGPLLAWPSGWNLPVVLGELVAGIALGPTGLGVLHAGNPTFTLLADIGFALIMFVAGTHVPVRDAQLRGALALGVTRAGLVGVVAVGLGWAISAGFDTGHAALYAVLIASSSAALVLPIVDSLRLGGPKVLQLLPQVAVADAACIVALPLAIDPAHALRAAVGALIVIAAAAALFVGLRYVEVTGMRRRVHRISERRKFALELRINLIILFALSALAVHTRVSIMLAGFSFGLAVAAVGEPRRLARQLFAVSDGFFAPLFFVWLGASLNLRDLAHRPAFIVLGLVLGLAAVLAHATMRLLGQPLPLGVLAAAQLGVPVAAATIGTQLHLLQQGEAAALILGALVTIGLATLAAGWAVRTGLVAAKPAAVEGNLNALAPDATMGVMSPTLGVIFLPFLPPERLASVARAADEAGLAELWLWEDCFQESGIATAAAALAWTSRLRVGVGLLPVPLRNVALTAMELATLARLFPDRLIAGVGHGVAEWMHQVGAGVESPMTLLREYVDALSGLLAGATVSTTGRYVSLREVRLDWPPSPPPPVLVGAVGPKSLALSGELADGTILSGRVAADDIRAAVAVIESGRAAAGATRAHTVVTYLPAATGPGAQARLDHELALWNAEGDDAGVAGDAAAIAAAVRMRAEAGADTVVLQPTRDDPDLEGFVHFVATEVAPLV